VTRGGFTALHFLLAAVLATVALCGGCMRKGVRLADLRAALPDASTVRLYDRPSDDGSALILEWGKVDDVVEGVSYAVEVAKSADDFETRQFKTVKVELTEDSLKSADPKYFGFSEANKKFYVATILPAKLFPPAGAPELTADHIKKLVADDVLSKEQSKLILAEMASDTPDEKLTDEEKACRKWLRRLKLYPRVMQLADEGKLPESKVQRAIRAMTDETADDALSGGDKADRRWLALLAAFIEKRDTKQRDQAAKAINKGVYYVRLAATDGRKKAYVLQDREKVVYSGQARVDTFKRFKLNNLVFALAFSGIVLAFIQIARRNPNLFIRRIAGLEAVDEAIGRATEMGRSVYFVHGLGSMGELATIAAVNVLSRVARRAADYDTRITVTNINPIVMAVSQEVVQQAYTEAGRPDAYDPDDVALSATSQFSYAAAVTGRMVRERPAAIFLIGSFMAESLLLSETGASTGAIQVAGTDSEHQLPFFITTCDYTLIGEELYAASAYLSREPRMLGSLRGQDIGKAFMMIAMVVGVILLTIAVAVAWFDADWITHLVKVL